MCVEHPAAEIDAVDDIAPLIRAAHLQDAIVAFAKLNKVIGLQHHVVEFEERELLLAIEPQLYRVEGKHPVDREMSPDVAQEIDIIKLVKPVGIVAHDGIAAGAFEFQEVRKNRADTFEIFVDRLVGENAAAFVLARWIADSRCAATHQRNRPVSGLLQPVQHHDWEQRANVQRGRCAIESDIGGNRASFGTRVEGVGFRYLMDKSAFCQNVEKIRFIGAHGGFSSRGLVAFVRGWCNRSGVGFNRRGGFWGLLGRLG